MDNPTLPFNGQYVLFTVKDGGGQKVELAGMFVEEYFASYFQCLEEDDPLYTQLGRRYDPLVDVISWRVR